MTRYPEIHIAPGLSAGGCLNQALRPGMLLVNQYPLSHGPLPKFESLDGWRRIREDYLRTVDPRGPRFSFDSYRRDLLSSASTLQEAESILLWIGTGLPEQLLLAWTVELLRLLSIEVVRLRVIQFAYHAKGFEIVSLGVLNPEQLKTHPSPASLNDAALRELRTAWAAVTAKEPDALLAFLAEGSGSLPFLRPSFRTLVRRFPDLTSGLNAWEFELLRSIQQVGPGGARIIGHTMASRQESPDWVGDGYLLRRLRRLADPLLPNPLIILTGNTVELRGTEVRLTSHGEQVLAGRANFVDLNGIDDWVGGTHLDSTRGRVWFHRDGNLHGP